MLPGLREPSVPTSLATDRDGERYSLRLEKDDGMSETSTLNFMFWGETLENLVNNNSRMYIHRCGRGVSCNSLSQ